MKIKNKLFVLLLIFIFMASVSSVVAEDSAVADDSISVSEGVDESPVVSESSDDSPVAADSNAGDDTETSATGDSDTADDADSENLTSISIKVDVLDKNPKVGDKVKVKITVENSGKYAANDVVAGFSFTDLYGNIDGSFKLIDDGGNAVSQADGGYEVEFGFLGSGDTKYVILTFLATEAGTKNIVTLVTSDNSIQEPDSQYNTSITVSESPSAEKNVAKASASKSLPAAGNPIALLALASLCLIPCLRRK